MGFLLRHGAHFVVGGVLLIAVVADLAWQRRKLTGAPMPRLRSSHVLVATGSVGAALVHIDVAPEHFREAVIYGVFFVGTALVQLAYAVLVLLRPSRLLLAAGAAGSIALISLWLVTRLVAVPLGPAAGSTETFGRLDVIASTFEALVVVTAVAALHSSRRVTPPSAAPQPAARPAGLS